MSERIERIEIYLQGLMSDAEKKLFEEEMHNDAILRKEVEHLRLINDALEVSAEDDLRSRLKQLEARSSEYVSTTTERKTRSLFPRLAAAASILVLICAAIWFLIGRNSNGLHQFSDRHYLGYDYTQLRGEYNTRSDFPFDIASGKYDRQKAVQWLLSWLETHPDDYEARYILADIYKDMNQIQKAKLQLSEIMLKHSILWGEKAEWNYILLSSTDTWDETAKSTFELILSDTNHSYHQQAKELEALMKK